MSYSRPAYLRPLVCTHDKPNGWYHSTEVSHYEKTVTLVIFRETVAGEFEYHERSGARWKYSTEAELDLIMRKTDQIGLQIGSLAEYSGGFPTRK